MRTKFLALIALIATFCLQGWAQEGPGIPLKEIGIKGNVLTFNNSSSELTVKDGHITMYSIGVYNFHFNEPKEGNVYHGWVSAPWHLNDGTCKVHVSNGKVSKFELYVDAGEIQMSRTYTITYDKDKVTSKEIHSTTTEEFYTVDNSKEIEKIRNQINNLYAEYGYLRYSFSYASAWANAYKKITKLESKLNALRESHGERRSRLVTKKETVTNVYSNFQYDEVGNVIAYTNSYTSTETDGQTSKDKVAGNASYTYDSHYLGEFYWNKLKESQDLDALEKFYLNEGCDINYRTLAENRWNTIVLSVLENEYKNNTEEVIKFMGKEITSRENYAKMNELVSAAYYPQATKIRDFSQLKKTINWKAKNGVKIFNKEYQNKILNLCDQLRADSIVFLKNKAQAEYDKALYTKAMETSNGILNISPNDQKALDLLDNSSYKQILKNVGAGTPNPNEMTQYLQTFPQGQHKAEVEDQYATYNLNVLKACEDEEAINKAGGMDLINFLRSLPVNDLKLAKSVKKTADKKEFIIKRGDVLDFGLGVSADFGPGMMGLFGEAGFRVGYLANFVNLYVGGRFGWMGSGVAMCKREDARQTINGGHFELLRASVPVQLRLHLAKKYDSAWYLGLGADLNFNINSKIKLNGVASTSTNSAGQQVQTSTGNPRLDNTMLFKDKNLVNKMTYSPRVALGYSGSIFNFELYGVYDLKDTFNKEYLENNHIDNLVHPQFYDGQVNNKWRIGAALRIMF